MKSRPSRGGRGRRSSAAGPRGPRRENIPELHPVEEPPEIESFEAWDLGPDILHAIAVMDIVKPTPIQALSIGPVLEGRDVIAKAQTGTGKTLAFGAPMMARIDAARATVLGLVLCPTRELAQQVHGVLATLGLPRGVRVAMCVGGDPIHPQIAQLQAGAQVVVGTPGRVLDLYQQRFLSFPWTEFVVLDEADKMFEIGFIDDIKKILSYTPEERQTLLFSATFPTEVLKLARESTRDPLEVATAAGTTTVDTVEQCYMEIEDEDRPMALVRMLEQSGPKDVYLVFCGRRTEVDRLMRSLERANLSIKALHGGYDQAARFRVMSAFRTGEVKALIATDVASRGLDVQHVTHVVNYSVPRDAEDYTHRIGRTGRAGRTGTSITFVTPRERRGWNEILERTKSTATELELPRRTGARGRGRDDEERTPREARPAAREETDFGAETPVREPERAPGRGRGRRGGRGRQDSDATRTREAAPAPRAPQAAPDETKTREPQFRTSRARSGEERPRRSALGDETPARGREERETRRAPERPERGTRPPEERPARGRGQAGGPARRERASTSDERPRNDESRGERGAGASRAPAGGRRDGARPDTREGEGPRVQDRSPEPRPRRRRRRGGGGRPGAERHDPDGLGRWGSRADDFH